MSIRLRRIWLTVAAILCAVSLVHAQTSRPAAIAVEPTTAPVGAHEKQLIQRPASVGNSATTTPSTAKPVVPTSTGMDTTRVVLALVLVIAIIFLLRWIAQQFFGAPSAKRSSRAVQVLSRSMVGPRQHVLLLQVGQRVIVVGDTGAQMHPLAEIKDPDEIAALMGQLRQDKSDPVSRAFGTFFGKAEKDYDEPDTKSEGADPGVDPDLATTQAELTGLIDKVRSASKQIGRPD